MNTFSWQTLVRAGGVFVVYGGKVSKLIPYIYAVMQISHFFSSFFHFCNLILLIP